MDMQQLPKVQPDAGPTPPPAAQANSPTSPPVQQAVPPANTQPLQPMAVSGMIADDVDLIEKEWVAKAKTVVAQTHSDPHAQLAELNKMRAEYLKKRYDKDLPGGNQVRG